MLWAKIRLFFQRNWLWVAIVLGFIVAILIPIWYMSGMEESVRRYIVGINVASLPWGILQTLVFVGFLYLLQYGGGFAQLRKSKVDASQVKVRFTDVIGLIEAKREAWEMVQLIKDRAALKRVGGKILHGMLMVGPPGCGKTMLAKAIATEAGIPFLATAGSEFVEIFVGVGPRGCASSSSRPGSTPALTAPASSSSTSSRSSESNARSWMLSAAPPNPTAP